MPSSDNPNVPAGFTYLGQFVDHDITLDLTSLSEKEKDPLAVENFRTPSLDLDSIYGLGPDGSPHLYARNPNEGQQARAEIPSRQEHRRRLRQRARRFPQRPAAQPRRVRADRRPPQRREPARRADPSRVPEVPQQGRRPAGGGQNPPADRVRRGAQDRDLALPVDDPARLRREDHGGRHRRQDPRKRAASSTASRRRPTCRSSSPRPPIGSGTAWSGRDTVTTASSTASADLQPSLRLHRPVRPDPRRSRAEPADGSDFPFPTLPSNWIIDWRRFYDFKTPPDAGLHASILHAASIRSSSPTLHELPGGGGNLAFRNLKRGVNLGLPSGQDVAQAMRIKNPLTPEEIATGTDGAVAKKHGLHKATPLWYYILKEAQVRHNGERLGPVGARIVAEVFVGLVHGDTESYLWRHKNWKPTLPSKKAGHFLHDRSSAVCRRDQPIDGDRHRQHALILRDLRRPPRKFEAAVSR